MLDHGNVDAHGSSAVEPLRHRMRHSAAHVMADAVLRLFPEAKMGIGPPTQDGFYYDFEVSRPFTPEDLESIQEIMVNTISETLPFTREEITREEALTLFSVPLDLYMYIKYGFRHFY